MLVLHHRHFKESEWLCLKKGQCPSPIWGHEKQQTQLEIVFHFVCAGVAFSLCMEQKHGPHIRLESLAGLDHQIAASLFCSPVNVCYIWFSCYTVNTPLLSAVSHYHRSLQTPYSQASFFYIQCVSDGFQTKVTENKLQCYFLLQRDFINLF